jgi:hypothetical protein
MADRFMLTHPGQIPASRPVRAPFLKGVDQWAAKKKDAEQ